MIAAIITARGGSKRIPGKNIRTFAGKPMIAWPIAAARDSGLFDRIIVSTDSEEIAEIARAWGAEVPFMRPQELSDDHTPTEPVFLHALEWLAKNDRLPEFACCIYPTTPFLLPEDLSKGLTEVRMNTSCVSLAVTTFAFPILRAFATNPDGTLAYHWPEYALSRSQDLPEFVHDAGQFYWVNGECFLKNKGFPKIRRPVHVPRKRVQDLDTPEDWETAILMAKVILKEEKA